MSHRNLGANQKRIIELLKAYPDSTVMEIIKLLYPGKQVISGDKTYNSTCRSFHLLEARGLIEKEGGQIKWKVKPKPQ